MKVSFFESRGVVHALVSDRSERVRISMGVKVEPFKFKGRFIGKGAKIDFLNNELEKKRATLGEICLKHGIENVRNVFTPEPQRWEAGTDAANLCHEYVDQMRSGEIRTKGAKRFSEESIRTYAHSADYLSKFAKVQESKDGTRFDIRQFNLELKQKAVVSWTSMFRKFEQWMTDRGMSVRSRQNVINQVGIMVRHWGEQMFIALPKTPSVLQAEKEVIALPPAFVGEFLSSVPPADTERRYVWEVAATILVTTLRIGDVLTLTDRDFNNDFTSIRKVLSKTGTCSMPIPKRLADIYIENLAKYGHIFCHRPNKSVVYKHLRTLMSGYPSLRQMVSLHSQDIHGARITEILPYWMVVTPHVLRKTAITSMLYHGVSHIHIRHASGHSHASRAFWQYVKVVDDLYERDISAAHERMGISN